MSRQRRRPVEALDRVDAGGDVAVGLQQAEHRLRLERDVGIDPEQVRVLLLRQELEHDHVAAAGDQAFAVKMERAGQPDVLRIEREAERARDVVHADPEDVARGRKQHVHGIQGAEWKHAGSPRRLCFILGFIPSRFPRFA
jgi:hypothetical protein